MSIVDVYYTDHQGVKKVLKVDSKDFDLLKLYLAEDSFTTKKVQDVFYDDGTGLKKLDYYNL